MVEITRVRKFVMISFILLLMTLMLKPLEAEENKCDAAREKCRKECIQLKGAEYDSCLLQCYRQYNNCLLD